MKPTPRETLREAVEIYGGLRKFARLIDIPKSTLWNILNKNRLFVANPAADAFSSQLEYDHSYALKIQKEIGGQVRARGLCPKFYKDISDLEIRRKIMSY